jgi:TPR repeat protein
MRRGRAIALSLLVLAGAATLLYLLVRSGQQSAVQRSSVAGDSRRAGLPAIAGSSMSAPVRGHADVPRTADTHSFNHRLRCVQLRLFYGRMAPPDALALLCEGKPLSALKILAPLAEAGDRHAINVLFGVRVACQDPKPSATSNRALMVALAQKNAASSQTVQRLDDLLAEEEHGPAADELEGCRQIATETMKLQPAVVRQFTDTLGRLQPMDRGQSELDVEIEYDRKMLLAGDVDGEASLASELLQKGSPESQREAMALLREAAKTLPSAKTELAECLLKGCPTPEPDPTEARRLLMDAASAGDLAALRILAGPVYPSIPNVDPNVPAPERYAWSQVLQRLNEEGCFGPSAYVTWAVLPGLAPDPLAMSPAESAAAQARAAALLAAQLNKTRALLGCD